MWSLYRVSTPRHEDEMELTVPLERWIQTSYQILRSSLLTSPTNVCFLCEARAASVGTPLISTDASVHFGMHTLAAVYVLISFTNFNAQFLYSLTIRMLHYNPRHVSGIKMPIFRRTNCIITASGIVTLSMYSMPDESSLLSSGILYCTVQRVTIPDAVII